MTEQREGAVNDLLAFSMMQRTANHKDVGREVVLCLCVESEDWVYCRCMWLPLDSWNAWMTYQISFVYYFGMGSTEIASG
eukprot:COSAG02_NODE_714_length_18094_cov_13.275688_7_plen_80_part_00